MPARPCPACASALQPLFLERSGKADLELDRCATCGGLWFDAGEAQAAAGRPLPAPRQSGPSRLKCPVCGAGLTRAEVTAGWSVETCAHCDGWWLDVDALGSLGNARLEALATRALHLAKRPRAAAAAGFLCAKCGRRAPFAEASGTARGLVCRDCTPRHVDDPAHGATILTRSDSFLSRLMAWLEGAADLEEGDD